MASGELSVDQERELERLLRTANLQRMRKQWLEAEDTCRKAIEISPENVDFREMLGDILVELGKVDQALLTYKTALEFAPGKESLETKFAKATLDMAESKWEQSAAQDRLSHPYRQAVRPRNPAWAFIWSALLPGLGQFYNGDMLKGGIVFVVWLVSLLIASSALKTPSGTASAQDVLSLISPVVWVMSFIGFCAWMYSVVDAPIVASKITQQAKKYTEPQF